MCMSLVLDIGTEDYIFHFLGIFSVFIKKLNSSVSMRVREVTILLSILPDILSGPNALVMSKAMSINIKKNIIWMCE